MIELTEAPIDASAVLAQVADPECGAEVLFVGTTRQWTDLPHEVNLDDSAPATPVRRIETSHLIYESYREMALTQMQRLEAEARSRWPLRQVAMVHRLGHVAATEASVAIAVSSPHRSEAFEAARWLIDELKHHVPIWKQEHYVQHGSQWIHPTAGNCNCGEHSSTPPHLLQPLLGLSSPQEEQ
jgi:molybdopterin synthase catalytic subunit